MSARIALAAAVGSLAALASAFLPAGDPDAFWHLALGRDVLASGPPRIEAYSWTAAGSPVLSDQWLGQALFALAYESAGWKGVVVLRALAGGAVVGLTALAALGERARPLVAILATLPALLLLRGVWTERPQLLALVLFAALVVLLRAALRGERRALWACVPLFLVWANVHGSYALGLAVLAPLALMPRRRDALLALAASALATLLTPAGLGTLTAPAGHFLTPPRYIQEWAVPDLVTPAGLIQALTLAAVLATALLGRAAGREALILVPVAFIALSAVRHAAFLGIAAAPFLAAHGPAAVRDLAESVGIRLPAIAPARTSRVAVAVSLAIAALSVTATVIAAPAEADLRAYPVAALPVLRAGPGLFNEYDWGGFLIWHAPGTKVFVDGRLTPYAPRVIDDYTTIGEAHPGWRETIARLGVRQVLVRPTAAVAVRARELGWRESASGTGFVLFEVP